MANMSDVGIIRTILLLVAVVCICTYLIEKSAAQINDKKIRYLFYCFIAKLLFDYFFT